MSESPKFAPKHAELPAQDRAFGAFVRTAAQEPPAFMGLVMAYADLDARAQAALLTEIAREGGDRGESLVGVLARLDGLQNEALAGMRGDACDGEAYLRAPEGKRHLILRWQSHELQHVEVSNRRELPSGALPTERDPERVIQCVTPIFFRYLQSGAARPAELDAFARWFDGPS